MPTRSSLGPLALRGKHLAGTLMLLFQIAIAAPPCLAADLEHGAASATPAASSASSSPSASASPSATQSVGSSPIGDLQRKPPTPQGLHDKGLPALTVAPDVIEFGPIKIGSSSVARRVTIAASAAAPISGTDIHAAGDFSVIPAKCEPGANGSCALSVTFTPTRVGISDSAIVVSDPAGGTSRVVTYLAGEGIGRCDQRTVFGCSGMGGLKPVAFLIALYVLALIVVRWNMIAAPARRLLRAEIEAVETRVKSLQVGSARSVSGLEHIRSLLTLARENAVTSASWKTLLDVLLWSRGQEIAGWGLLHEAEEQLVRFLDPEDLHAALERSQAQLRQVGTLTAVDLADRIKFDLPRTVVVIDDYPAAILREVLDFLRVPDAGVRAQIAGVLATPQTTAPALYPALASRIALLLLPQSQTLGDRAHQAVGANAQGTPAEYQALLADSDECLARAQQVARALTDQGAKPATADNDWIALFARANDQFFAPAELLSGRVQSALSAKVTYPLERWRALQSEALGLLYDRTDTDFATLISWHNKTIWLTGCGLLLILALAGTLENEVLFLLGATGGLLSRLSRSLYRQDVPNDYGASWTTLFLSPVVGALAGWTGVLLVLLAVKLQVLGSLFALITWDNSFNPLSFGIAVLLGFSERAFDTILSQLEGKIVNQSSGTTTSPPPLAISTGTLPGGVVGQQYDVDLSATGGKASYGWSLLSGVLPAGLTLAGGHIGGKPLTKGVFAFTVQVKETTAGGAVSKQLTIEVT